MAWTCIVFARHGSGADGSAIFGSDIRISAETPVAPFDIRISAETAGRYTVGVVRWPVRLGEDLRSSCGMRRGSVYGVESFDHVHHG